MPLKSKYISSFLALLLLGCFLSTYNYTQALSPQGLWAVVLCFSGWGLLRLVFSYFPKATVIATTLLLLWGCTEALWGLAQLYGWLPAGHNRFKITGSFFNPGPYGGFLAVLLPLGIHYTYLLKHQKSRWYNVIVSLLIPYIIVLPATLSRTAWIAAFLGCGIVLLLIQWQHISLWLKKQPKRNLFYISLIFSTLIIALAYGGYQLKKDSANGRLLIWKLSTQAAIQQGLVGEGLGSFAHNYALAQQNYFKNNGTEIEKSVAGVPEYAFNEYLRLWIEQGALGLLLWLLLFISIFYHSLKNKQYGAAGALIAFATFAFASYPFYLWQFLIAIVLIASIGSQSQVISCKKYFLGVLTSIVFTISITYGFFQLYKYRQAEKQWQQLSMLYNSKQFVIIENNYTLLYPTLNSNPKFIFEYASILNAVAQYRQANIVIERGLAISADPMFYNLQGRNYQQMQQYDKAEAALLQSTYLLPNRIYPYYLLTKLYSDSAYYQPDKLLWAANKVLLTPIKIPSPAISEMQQAARTIINCH